MWLYSLCTFTEKHGCMLCNEESTGLNPGLEIDYIENSCDFPQSIQANATLVPQVS
jgi:hypothetical protein